ncbi:HNH endonuclease [Shewanella frigidimarina]|uniref:HNH endonuclease n=1 Tax=Shewanella frigidimarina TaxID=56812 RepID=UPI003D7A42D2
MIRGVCAAAGCKSIAIDKSRCALHQHKAQPKTATKTSNTRLSTTINNHIYHSTKWRKLRDRKFKQNPICEHCLRYNIITPTAVVDHIKELNDNPELAYVYSNLQGLCHKCHNTKTALEVKSRNKPKTLSSSELFNQLKNKKE